MLLDGVLVAGVASIVAGTVALLVAGRRSAPAAVRFAPTLLALGALAMGSPGPAIVLGAIAALTVVMPRHWYPVGAWLFSSLLATFAGYGVYLAASVILLGGTVLATAIGMVLFVFELGAMSLILAAAFEMIDALCAPAPTLPHPPLTGPPEVVCLQVPTYNEPPNLVIETVRSLVAIDYPDVRVQVIDNNTADPGLWEPVEAECARLRAAGHRVDFVHLPEWPGFKGGALNWGLRHLDPEVSIVGVVDADYVVAPDWLSATVPYFAEPSVGFVQTPQDYRDWEHSSFYRSAYVGFAYFFKVGMVSRARRDSIIFAGTMGLIRRSTLEEVGGWDEEIITEDAEVSLRVLARGYRPVYVPIAYGRGIMPLSYESLRKQRYRWAFGGIQILRRHARTIFGRRSGLSLGQRYDHLLGGLWWFNDGLTLGFTLFAIAAALAGVTGRPFIVQRLTGLGLVLPIVFIVLNLVRYLWGLGVTTGSGPAVAIGALRVNLSLSWVIALACFRALTRREGVFLRTPKFAGAASIRELRIVWVETSIAIVCTVLLGLDLAVAGFASFGVILAFLLAWAILIYGSAVAFALGDPTRAPLASVLRQKAALEVAPRVGRAAATRRVRVGALGSIAVLLSLTLAVASESDRPSVLDLPFERPPTGPISGIIGPTPTPSIDVSLRGASPHPSGSLTPTGPRPGSTAAAATSPPRPGRSASPAPPAKSSPTPVASPPVATPTPRAPVPTPRRTPPVTLPTPPVAVPTPSVGPARTPPPRPSPTPRIP